MRTSVLILMTAAMSGCVGEIYDVPRERGDAGRADALTSDVRPDEGAPDTAARDAGDEPDVSLTDATSMDVPVDGTDDAAPDASCVPTAEVCNGADDDCDDAVDEALVETCGSDVGACAPGSVMCAAGAFPACTPAVGPSAETCDGVDQDCDGMTDEGVAPMTCGSNIGFCMAGTQTCSGGAFGACTGQRGPRAERCDGVDDDCDSRTDEGVAPMTCGTNVGYCMAGTRVCSGGTFAACSGNRGPRAERCDGVDDDCDSRTDEGVAPMTCGTNVGTCRTGTRRCSGGSFGGCTGNIGPRPEIDDGLDNDCNGVDDNGIPCESAIERDVRLRTNTERTSRGRGALSCDRDLRRAARKYAQVICDARMNPLQHNWMGTTPTTRIEAEGVMWTTNGENLAAGQATPAAVVAAWMASPPHRANILNGAFGRVGVGYVRCSAPSPHNHIWVQNFAN